MNKLKNNISLVITVLVTFFYSKAFAGNNTEKQNDFPKKWKTISLKMKSEGDILYSYSSKYNWILYMNKEEKRIGILHVLSGKKITVKYEYNALNYDNCMQNFPINADKDNDGRVIETGPSYHWPSLYISPRGDYAVEVGADESYYSFTYYSLTTNALPKKICLLQGDFEGLNNLRTVPHFYEDGSFSCYTYHVYDYYDNRYEGSLLGDPDMYKDLLLKRKIKEMTEFYCKNINKLVSGLNPAKFTKSEQEKVNNYRELMFNLLYDNSFNGSYVPTFRYAFPLFSKEFGLYKIKRQKLIFNSFGELIEEGGLEDGEVGDDIFEESELGDGEKLDKLDDSGTNTFKQSIDNKKYLYRMEYSIDRNIEQRLLLDLKLKDISKFLP